jgi:hypothetical protein
MHRVYTEVAVKLFEVLDRKYSPATQGNHKESFKITHVRAEIWNCVFPNRKQECCHSYGGCLWDKTNVLGMTIKEVPCI